VYQKKKQKRQQRRAPCGQGHCARAGDVSEYSLLGGAGYHCGNSGDFTGGAFPQHVRAAPQCAESAARLFWAGLQQGVWVYQCGCSYACRCRCRCRCRLSVSVVVSVKGVGMDVDVDMDVRLGVSLIFGVCVLVCVSA